MDCHITDVQVLFFMRNNLKKTGSSYLSAFLLVVSKLICTTKNGLRDFMMTLALLFGEMPSVKASS